MTKYRKEVEEDILKEPKLESFKSENKTDATAVDRRERVIGIFDSGIGGLTVFKAISKILPYENIVYIGDTARVPYGAKSPSMVTKCSTEVVRVLLKESLKLLVIACNTASACSLSALIDIVDPTGAIPVLGVIGPGAHDALLKSKTGRIGVIGTESTIRQAAYQRVLTTLSPNVEVWSQACPLFVPLAEEGWVDNEATYFAAKHYLQPLMEHSIDTLILGCTHYPIMKKAIRTITGNDVVLVDSAEATAREVLALLQTRGLNRVSDVIGRRTFMVTDAPERFSRVGEMFLGSPLEDVTKITL